MSLAASLIPLARSLTMRLREDLLLLLLLIALGPLLWLAPASAPPLSELVDWRTIGALAGLMVLSRGLEESGYLAFAGRWLLSRIRGERLLAATLVLFSAAASAVITNDVALFIVVPLTVGLRRNAALPIGRLIVFEALAVNAGSALSPAGNPQNLFLWNASRSSFLEFTLAMLPLAAGLLLLLLALIPLGFPRERIAVTPEVAGQPLDKPLLWLSLGLYPLFLMLTDFGWAMPAAIGIGVLYLVVRRRVLSGVDWLLVGVFILMFIDLGLLARFPSLATAAGENESVPGGMFTAGAVLSQLISNVPAAIFLESFTDDWRTLAWGISVGGFGGALGSLANLIALRLSRQPGLWRDFHRWSLPMLAGGFVLGLALLNWLPS